MLNIKDALNEDLLPAGDVTSELLIPPDANGELSLFPRHSHAPIVISGTQYAEAVFGALGADVQTKAHYQNGELYQSGEICTLRGNLRAILAGERLFINLIQRCISIATYTRQFVNTLLGTKCRLLDTRKTTPMMRELERQAVRDGGGHNHRFNLSSAILIKDNHIAACGGVREVLRKLRHKPHMLKVELEVDSLEQLEIALSEHQLLDVIMLDNFTLEDMNAAVKLNANRCLLEVSGGVSLQTAADIARTGVDFISVGSLTNAPPIIDLGLDY